MGLAPSSLSKWIKSYCGVAISSVENLQWKRVMYELHRLIDGVNMPSLIDSLFWDAYKCLDVDGAVSRFERLHGFAECGDDLKGSTSLSTEDKLIIHCGLSDAWTMTSSFLGMRTPPKFPSKTTALEWVFDYLKSLKGIYNPYNEVNALAETRFKKITLN